MVRRLVLLCALLSVLAAAPAAHAALAWPSQTLQIGVDDEEDGAAALRATAPFGLRYHYLAGGVNTGNSWQSWATGGGSFVPNFVADSTANGMIPVFSYYELRQSQPGAGQSDEQRAVVTNLADRDTMRAWFEDLKVFFQRAGSSGTPVVLQVEPDLWGYVQVQGGDDASAVPAQVAGSGMDELKGLPNTAAGVAQGVKRLRDTYAPNVLLGYPVSVWGTGKDIAVSNEGDEAVDVLGARSARFYRSLHTSFDTVFAEFADRDSGRAVKRDGRSADAAWWDAADFARFARYLGVVHRKVRRPVVLWQIPLGNTLYRAMDDSPHHYADNRVQWLLGGNAREHLKPYIDAGVVALLFGSGQSDGTCACDAAGDGVTNPPPNGTATRQSLSADDDGGYFRSRVNAYYRDGALPLAATTRSPARKHTTAGIPSKLRHPGRFSTRAKTSRGVVRRGGSVRIRAAVRPTKSQRALVSIEVYRGGDQVFQRYFDHAVLRRGRARSFSTRWTVGADAAAGEYVVKLGVFAPGFDGLRAWNDHAARVRVA
jgi:hypothetical protein